MPEPADGQAPAPKPPEASPLPLPIAPPKTDQHVVVNQQFNFQIPVDLVDRLSPDQNFELMKAYLGYMERSEAKRIEAEMHNAGKEQAQHKTDTVVGILIVLAGYIVAAYLGMQGHELIAMSISAPLTALVAVVLGRRLD